LRNYEIIRNKSKIVFGQDPVYKFAQLSRIIRIFVFSIQNGSWRTFWFSLEPFYFKFIYE